MRPPVKKFILASLAAGILAFIPLQVVFAISPDYLKNGRTYDEESSYIQWNGSVSYIYLFHRDGTSLPPSEGGGSCGSGCTEQVTRIQSGSSISGNFTFLNTFNVQLATTGDSGAGTAIISACGQVVTTKNLYLPGGGTPGFNNVPNPAWSVPTSGDCTWSVSASGGYVDFRAVTTSFRSAPAPTVDIKINGGQGPLNQSAPGGYTLSWTSSNAASCSASGSWSGSQATAGSLAISNQPAGTVTYTLTCINPSGSASDSVTANILSPPTVDVKVNNQNGPLSFVEPASFTVTWSSANASSCQAEGSLSGSIANSGSRALSGVLQGTYTYTVRCFNSLGAQAVDSVQVTVSPPIPTVDLKVNGGDGPLTLAAPASYTLTWTSQFASICTASSSNGGWSGAMSLAGSQVMNNVPLGTYTYTLTCSNVSGSANDSVTVTVLSPLSGTISLTYARLVWFASNLGQPAQTLFGSVTGGMQPHTISVHVRAPSGQETVYPRSGSAWSLTPVDAGNVNFGTTEQGTWSAWAILADSLGGSFQTNTITWEVAWFPVHGLP